jgi:phosphatidylserine decarboxylase
MASLKDQNLMDTIKRIFVPIHPAGYPFIGIFAGVSLLLFWLLGDVFGWLGVILTLWCVYFFRDPARYTPTRDGLIISPADGVVEMITEVPAPTELDMDPLPRTRVSIFLSVMDVHIQRMPADGIVTKTFYFAGKFLNAALEKASEENERQLVKLQLPTGEEIAVVQIAGLVARRIICDAREGDQVKAGQRYGLIRFGSRVDIYLPAGVNPLVAVGQYTIGGETVIADLHSNETARLASVR